MHSRTDKNAHSALGRFVGDVSAAETWHRLQAQPEAVLIDIRTRSEWAFVGVPDLTELNKTPLQVEWQLFPGMECNPRFLRELQAQGVTRQHSVYLICRSGIRSHAAAEFLAQQGYNTYNVTDGFEGPLDERGHRGARGWRAEGLPWRQS
ncbi:MAG TPA: rhodanese-like domain-containing protein [Candidatus Competibacter sp.]|nr:rhodanese-like domain-containing protein [Candidatus Competibacter sp.]